MVMLHWAMLFHLALFHLALFHLAMEYGCAASIAIVPVTVGRRRRSGRSRRFISIYCNWRVVLLHADQAGTPQAAVAPGLAFGEHGDGHVRISLVENQQRIRQAARNVRAMFLYSGIGVERLSSQKAAQ